MSLYYYSLSQKKFAPLFPGSVNEAELSRVNRYDTRTQGALGDFMSWLGGVLVDTALVPILGLVKGIFWATGLFVSMAGYLLDTAIKMTISSSIYSDLQVINVGWTTVRDFSNMFFIFALLYIAIKTILGLAGSSTKRWVANLIIAAILINFSLFATKVVIDSGNVLAMGFWDKMQVNGTGEPSAAENLMQGLKLQTSFDIKDKDGNFVETDNWRKIVVYMGGTLVMLVAGYVFLAGAIMMLVRTVTLIFLMIASPFAFLSFALPVSGGFANKWLSKLIGNTFVAPAFLAMIYLDIIIINSLDLQKLTQVGDAKFGGMFSGDVGSFPIIYNFLMVIIFMLASLTVASAVSSGAGETGSRWSKRLIGYGAGAGLAGAAMSGRQFGGRFGKMVSENKTLQKMAANKDSRISRFTGNLALASGEKMKKGTWDARNAGANKALGLGGVSAGQGGKKSYDTHGGKIVGMGLAGAGTLAGKIPGVRNIELPDSVKSGLTKDYVGTDREMEYVKIAKSRYATDPEAQRKFLLDKGVNLDAKRNKETSDQIKRDTAEKAHMEKLQDQLKQVSGLDMKGLATLDTPEKVAAMNTQIAEKITQMGAQEGEDFVKGFAQALDKLSSKKYAEMGSGFLDLDIVQRSTTGRQLSEVHTKLGDGTLAVSNADAYRTKLSQNIMWNGTDSAKSVMKNQIRQGNSNFIVDTQRELDWATTHPADEETREKNIKNAMSFMSYEDVARMDISKLQTIDPYLTDAHYKAMGKNKKEALKAAVAAQQQTP